jgi:hypothetical protein
MPRTLPSVSVTEGSRHQGAESIGGTRHTDVAVDADQSGADQPCHKGADQAPMFLIRRLQAAEIIVHHRQTSLAARTRLTLRTSFHCSRVISMACASRWMPELATRMSMVPNACKVCLKSAFISSGFETLA